ncbi:hypothetical protein C0992_007307 [Termitomyces sp. T32_za158]|nr:hypothetical protein C0992_007307 [Termitomyces sp. T32_za158]
MSTSAEVALDNVKDNKKAYRKLEEDASEIVSIIRDREPRVCHGAATLPPGYLKHTEDLSGTLAEICKSVEGKVLRNTALDVTESKSDPAMIQEYRERLKHSLEVFNLKSNIDIHETLASIQRQLAEIAERAGQSDRQHESPVVAQFEGKAAFGTVGRSERDLYQPEKIIKMEEEKFRRRRQTTPGFRLDLQSVTHANPFPRSASFLMLDTPDHSPRGYLGNSFHSHVSPVHPAFPTPLPASPGYTLPFFDFSSVRAGTPAFPDHNTHLGSAVMGGYTGLCPEPIVKWYSGNGTVNDTTNFM